MFRPVWSSLETPCPLWLFFLASSVRINPAVSELGECNLYCILGACLIFFYSAEQAHKNACAPCKCFIRLHNLTKGLTKRCAAAGVA